MVSCPSLTKQTSMAGFFLKDVSPVPFCFQPTHTTCGIWQSVKRSLPQRIFSHQNTNRWISWHSQAIRKIQFGTISPPQLSDREVQRTKRNMQPPVTSTSILFNTFWFIDASLLLEKETHFFLLPYSKDLTSEHETIVFGRWNYIVWRLKQYCLARETILFRARFACFPKMKCIVF